MRYICLGYLQESDWHKVSEADRNAIIDECFAYDDWLVQNGFYQGGFGLQSTATATTLRRQGDKIAVLDGPFAETKEQLGGVMIIEASDLNHAIQLMSNHPGTKMGGCWEIRPAANLEDLMAESSVRRGEGA